MRSDNQPQFRGDIVNHWSLVPPRIIELYPTAAILLGDWVAIDFAVSTVGFMQHCKQAAVADQGVCGVAMEAAAGASTTTPIRVLIKGVYSLDNGLTASATVNVVTGVLRGDDLMVSAATAGRAAKYTSATVTAYPIGAALADSAANAGSVYVRNPLGL
jgi:hypothetical protein